MAERFRDLERLQKGRPKDIVLMATVSSFESLRFPSRAEMQQFSELFEPLYQASSEDARRQAVAALSQSPHVPDRAARFIGTRPIDVAALFLTRAPALGDETLLHILETTGPDHARAVARRASLSPKIVEALVDRHHEAHSRKSGEERIATRHQAERLAREEAVRDELRALMQAERPVENGPPPLAPASEMHQALFVRFARARETGMLAVALADALSSSQWLSERILLDLSGRQLAETLLALAVPADDCRFILARLHSHITENDGQALLAGIDAAMAVDRVESWRRADCYSNGGSLPQAANSADAPSPLAGRSRAVAG